MLAAVEAACSGGASFLLWALAVGIAIFGIVTLIRGAILAGIALLIVAALVGPGGISLFC